MKKPKKKYRNPFVTLAISKSAGLIRNKKNKRKNCKNKQREFLDENY